MTPRATSWCRSPTSSRAARACAIEIGGHTDSDGSDQTNQALSERRAQAVADYLTPHGIPGDRFTTRGYGETNPIVPNDSAAHKARNRRIEFRVIS